MEKRTRIIETIISKDETRYYLEVLKTVRPLLWYIGLAKKKQKYVKAKFKVYSHIISEEFEVTNNHYYFSSLSKAFDYENKYLEYLDSKTINYRGFKAYPIFIHNDFGLTLKYIDYKSSYFIDRYNYGYSFVGSESQFKERIDEKLFVKTSRVLR